MCGVCVSAYIGYNIETVHQEVVVDRYRFNYRIIDSSTLKEIQSPQHTQYIEGSVRDKVRLKVTNYVCQIYTHN